MKNLQAYVDQANRWATLGNREAAFPNDLRKLSVAQATELFHRIDGELSPENLTCDGELSRSEVSKRATFFKAVAKELVQLGFSVPDDCYEIEPSLLTSYMKKLGIDA
jgi:hypothetical protein